MLRWRSLAALLALVTACTPVEDNLIALTFALDVDPAVDLGEVYEGYTGAGSFSVTASGTGTVEIVGLHSDSNELTFAEQMVTVSPQTSESIEVQWTPTGPGPFAARLRVFARTDDRDYWWVEAFGTALAVQECDDGNACTLDEFNTGLGECVFLDLNGPCDDGNACTTNDTCGEGECRGAAVECEDETDCTDDFCEPTSGCVYLPIPGACADDDPCTVDTCESGVGCSFPAAPNNTICGAVDCQQLHVCIHELGGCQRLDISGSSDGLPCEDFNPCTEDDACLNGECNPGLAQRDTPGVIQTLETFGGAGATVAADAPLYLFADPDALRLAVWSEETVEEETISALDHVATVSQAASLRPIALGSARFLIAGSVGQWGVLDAADPSAPSWLWQAEAIDPGPPALPFTDLAIAIDATVPVTGGVVYAARFAYADAGTPVAENAGLYFAALAAPDQPLAPPVRIVPLVASLEALSADGDVIAWGSDNAIHWAELDGAGAVVETSQRPYTGGRLSVRGRRVALWADDQVWIDAIEPPASGSAFVAWASYDFFDGAADLLLTDSWLYLTRLETPLGVMALPVVAGLDQRPVPTLVDAMPASRIERDAGHLVVAGEIALPLKAVGGDGTTFERISGSGHGDITALTDDGEGVRLAGPVAVGRYHVRRQAIVDWALRWGAATRSPPWILRGLGRDVAVPTPLVGRAWPWGPDCDGYLVEAFGADPAEATSQIVCGLFPGARYAAAGGRLWAFTPSDDSGTWEAPRLRAWNLGAEADGQPLIDVDDLGGVTDGAPVTALRASENCTRLALITSDGEALRVEIFLANAGALSPPAGALFPCAAGDCDASAAAPSLVIDDNLLLRGEPAALRSYGAVTPPATVTAQAELPMPEAEGSPRPWVANGDRVWVGWEADGVAYLRQVEYTQGILYGVGDAELAKPPKAVFDAVDLVVTAVDQGLVVVEPACVPF